ncbi:hypothetical protein HHK36_031821 [Tetracentron sinense]|uniref:Helitron helicase-like domain-containing protein n=1 Tax=Tetracentron sinense TaxID=13715 RepID=A0A835CY64_TETSI|nr:hypothetical protein HHK36_031821 [Tetracentron sinense]
MTTKQKELRREQQRSAYRRRRDQIISTNLESPSQPSTSLGERRVLAMIDTNRDQDRENLLLHGDSLTHQIIDDLQCNETMRDNVQHRRLRIRDIRHLARQFPSDQISNNGAQLDDGENYLDPCRSCLPTQQISIKDRSIGCTSTIHQISTRLTQVHRHARQNQSNAQVMVEESENEGDLHRCGEHERIIDNAPGFHIGHSIEGRQARDIIVQTRTGHLQNVADTAGYYDPLQYPLLLPYGTHGWDIDVYNERQRRVSCRSYYAYMLQDVEALSKGKLEEVILLNPTSGIMYSVKDLSLSLRLNKIEGQESKRPLKLHIIALSEAIAAKCEYQVFILILML